MTSTIPARSYRSQPPTARTDPEIVAIMRELKVNKDKAYDIKAERHSVGSESVPEQQRLRVLRVIVTHSLKTANEIKDHMHAQGDTLDHHDVVKTLWALQKNRFVRFYERNRQITGIRVTAAGEAALAGATGTGLPFAPPADKPQEEVTTVMAERIAPPLPLPPDLRIDRFSGGNDWPAIQDLVVRAERATKIHQAVAILGDIGEEEYAIELLNKVHFTPLEEEVIRLLHDIAEEQV